MASVELDAVHKSYGSTKVVKGVSLQIESGQFVSLLGPSGCGKTTSLRMIAGLERPDAGTIRIGGDEVDSPRVRVAPEKRRLGMVFQSYAVWPHKSVAQNVAYPLQLERLDRGEIGRRVTEALSWVRLQTLADRMPSQLSGGQLQRVAIARALIASPRVLLLDEPLSNLDAALREELRGEIAMLRARLGTTMIFVTHDQHEALALSDRIAVMHQGVIEQFDAPEALYQRPSTAFVAGFVGGSNCFDGVIREDAFEYAGLRFPLTTTHANGSVTLCVRAESITLDEPHGPPLTVLARLFLGSTMELRLALGDQILRVVTTPRSIEPGARVNVGLSQVHIFRR